MVSISLKMKRESGANVKGEYNVKHIKVRYINFEMWNDDYISGSL